MRIDLRALGLAAGVAALVGLGLSQILAAVFLALAQISAQTTRGESSWSLGGYIGVGLACLALAAGIATYLLARRAVSAAPPPVR